LTASTRKALPLASEKLRPALRKRIRITRGAVLAGVAIAGLGHVDLASAQMRSPSAATTPEQGQPALDVVPPAAGPWSGLTILVTPLPTTPPSPYEEAIADSQMLDPSAVPTAGTPLIEDEAAIYGTLVDPVLGAPRGSVWSSLGSTSAPSLPEGAPSPYSELSARNKKPVPKAALLPTQMELKEGPASFSLSTTASGSLPVSSALNPSAGGSSGEVKGRIGYEQDNLMLYGTGAVGASASTSIPALYDNVTVGSRLNVPLAPLGMAGDSLGAKVEMNSAQTVTTGLELRGGEGTTERFISIQRSATPDSDPSGVLRAGVLGRF